MCTTLWIENRTAAKPHRCIWCDEPIGCRELYVAAAVVFDGEFQSQQWHPECVVEQQRQLDRGELDPFEGFPPGENHRPYLATYQI